jgi:hypothetical protein
VITLTAQAVPNYSSSFSNRMFTLDRYWLRPTRKVVQNRIRKMPLSCTLPDDHQCRFLPPSVDKKTIPLLSCLAIEYSRSSFPPTTLSTPHLPPSTIMFALRMAIAASLFAAACGQAAGGATGPWDSVNDSFLCDYDPLGQRATISVSVQPAPPLSTICNLPQSATSPHLSPQRCLTLAAQALRPLARATDWPACSSLAVDPHARNFDDPPSLESRRSMMNVMIKLSRPRRANAWLRTSELARLGKAQFYPHQLLVNDDTLARQRSSHSLAHGARFVGARITG